MAKAAEVLEEYGVEYSMKILSAHRTQRKPWNLPKQQRRTAIKVLIA